MTIGNALYTRFTTTRFDSINSELNALQGQIAEGTNDARPSADPTRAAMLSAARDQQALIKSYASNAASADNRLSLADAAMGEMSALMRQVKDVALQMANTATSEIGYATLRSEAAQLREALVGVANTRDAAGQPLFSGLSSETPFRVTPQGVTYGGDTGQTQVQISESLRVMTGLSGADLLMSVPTEQGVRSVFDIFKDLDTSMSTLASTVARSSAMSGAKLDLTTSTHPKPVTFTLSGPAGEAEVDVLPQTGAPGPVIDAINAQTSKTGVKARLAEDGIGILLAATGTIAVSGFSAEEDEGVMAKFQATEGSGGPVQALRSARMSNDSILAALNDALDHLSDQQGRLGSVAAQVDAQGKRLVERQATVDQAVSGLNDLDLAAASTRLAQLMTSQQAAMQTYSMITSKTLFDYLG